MKPGLLGALVTLSQVEKMHFASGSVQGTRNVLYLERTMTSTCGTTGPACMLRMCFHSGLKVCGFKAAMVAGLPTWMGYKVQE